MDLPWIERRLSCGTIVENSILNHSISSLIIHFCDVTIGNTTPIMVGT